MTKRVPRRVLLQSATVGIAGLTGCTLLGSDTESQTPRLVDFNVLNFHDEPHTVHVRLDLDGETVYRESKQLAAVTEEDDSEGAVLSDYPMTAEPYLLSAWRDDQSESDARPLDFASFDTECLGVDVQVGTYGVETESSRLSIHYTTNCRVGTERSLRNR